MKFFWLISKIMLSSKSIARASAVKMVLSFGRLVWFIGFYGISTFVGYLTPNLFLCK